MFLLVAFYSPYPPACQWTLINVEQHFQLPKGYYGLESIFLLLALMALARIKTIEDLRYCAPGDGKVVRLDRIPEVRTLREKVKHLALKGQGKKWSAAVCSQWMHADTKASRSCILMAMCVFITAAKPLFPAIMWRAKKLCLRATVDYWVNAMADNRSFISIKTSTWHAIGY